MGKYYQKGLPCDLMPKEILEHVPNLYGQENIKPLDKVVHAFYFIPLICNWTWYLTEYDPKTQNAFGFVLGSEPEWGYFNLAELKELGAQRWLVDDFPQTFESLIDIDLKKQMSQENIARVFQMSQEDIERVFNKPNERNNLVR